jgi:hypothetical protein
MCKAKLIVNVSSMKITKLVNRDIIYFLKYKIIHLSKILLQGLLLHVYFGVSFQ